MSSHGIFLYFKVTDVGAGAGVEVWWEWGGSGDVSGNGLGSGMGAVVGSRSGSVVGMGGSGSGRVSGGVVWCGDIVGEVAVGWGWKWGYSKLNRARSFFLPISGVS